MLKMVRMEVLLSIIKLVIIKLFYLFSAVNTVNKQLENCNLVSWSKFYKVFFIGRYYSRIISLDLFDGAFLIKEVFNQGRFWKSNLRKKKKANWNNSKIYFRTLLKWFENQNKWKIRPGKNIFLSKIVVREPQIVFKAPWQPSMTGLLAMILLYEKRYNVMWNHWKEIMVVSMRDCHPMKKLTSALTTELTR